MQDLPSKKYSVIYADPPWKYSDIKSGTGVGVKHHYSCLTNKEICEIPVGNVTEQDSALFMWTTSPFLEQSFSIISAWGFKYKCVAFTWMKKYSPSGKLVFGPGNYTRGNAEFCLLGIKGRLKVQSRSVPAAILSFREKHSKKPDEVRTRIEQLYGDVARLELFARERAPGWYSLGNQLDQTIKED